MKYKYTIIFHTECFLGDKKSVIKAIKETHYDNKHVKEYFNCISEIEQKLAI